jgi:hypothetical protein
MQQALTFLNKILQKPSEDYQKSKTNSTKQANKPTNNNLSTISHEREKENTNHY